MKPAFLLKSAVLSVAVAGIVLFVMPEETPRKTPGTIQGTIQSANAFKPVIGPTKTTLRESTQATFSIVDCVLAKSGFPLKDIAVSDADETDIFPTQTIRVNVSQIGTYVISTNQVNGLSFSGTGTFTQTGLADVVLSASGMPLNYGNFTYALDGCSFERYTYIPDRRFKDVTNQPENHGGSEIEARHHRFIYRIFESENTDEEWLQSNLGSNYNKIGHPDFNPDASPSSVTDTNAFGSLYQWGRFSDGHEFMDWTSGVSLNDTTAVKSVSDSPGHNKMILGPTGAGDWRQTPNHELWKGEGGTNNPCPCGFRVPVQAEFRTEADASNLQTLTDAFNSPFKMVGPSARSYLNGLVESAPGVQSVYWTGTSESTNSQDFHFQQSVYEHITVRGFAFSVRCIMMNYKFEMCDEGHDGQEVFALSDIASVINADYLSHSVSFYTSYENARLAASGTEISGDFTALSAQNPNIVFARLEDANGEFVNGIKIRMYVHEMPEVREPSPLFYCSTIGSPVGMFNLKSVESEIMDDITGLSISYYTSFANAEAAGTTGRINSPATYTGAAGSVFIRVANDAGCVVIQEIPLQISTMTLPPQNLNINSFCAGLQILDLTSYIGLFTDEPGHYQVRFYDNQADANSDNVANAIENPSAFELPQTPGTTTLWLNFSLNGGVNCAKVVSSLQTETLPPVEISTDFAAYEICLGETLNIQAQTNGIAVNWYGSQDSLTPFHSGFSFTPPPMLESETFWLEAENENSCTSERIAVTLSVREKPELAFETVEPVCPGSAAVLQAVANPGETVNWYDSANSTTPVYSGISFETPPVSSPVSFWAELTDVNGCTSERVSIDVIPLTLDVAVFSLPLTYCVGAFADDLPLVSSNGISGSWLPEVIDTSVPGTRTYVFTPDPGICAEGIPVAVEISVTEPELVTFTMAPEIFLTDLAALPTLSDNGFTGHWTLLQNGNLTLHTFYPDDEQCAAGTFTVKSLVFPHFFTPNGDGVNDFWMLSGVEEFETVSVRSISIFDRYGKLISQLPASEKWDGTFNGSPLPASDYWFRIEYEQDSGSGISGKTFTGHFSLKR